ncbi:glycosyltransferase family 10 domain-containing protein [Thermodesulfobacteriota bacterium]
MTIPEKLQKVSWVVGNAKDLPGHYLRFSLLDFFRQNAPDIELFGRAVRPIDDKWQGIVPFYYSLAIENNSGPDMWTEKLADCFLGWTIPFYYGCTNLEEYFPKDSFIQLDIHDPEKTLTAIRENATPENWASRLPALEEARRLILQRYQLFPFLAERIKTVYPLNEERDKEPFVIPPYHRSMNAHLLRFRYKLRKKLGLLAEK